MARKYRLLAGSHIEPDPTIQPWHREVDPRVIDPKTGEPKVITWPQDRTYRAGDIIETENDLLKFNCRDANGVNIMSPKFALLEESDADAYQKGYEAAMKELAANRAASGVSEAAAAGFNTAFTDKAQYPSTLDSMTVEELKAFASEEEIDLGKANNRKDILAIIRKHQPAAV